MAFVLNPGENVDINSGVKNGFQLTIPRKYYIAFFSAIINSDQTVNSPDTKINTVNPLPPIGQRWPRRN